MDKYRITMITDKNGTPRTDGRYPMRIGRICKNPIPFLNYPPCIEYLENSDGSDYSERYLRISSVERVSEHDNVIEVETKNSIYRFERVEDL